jgi:sugar phosphate isomerase/epimerase
VAGWPVGLIVPLQDPTPFSPFSPEDLEETLKKVARVGFDAVELAITDPAELNPRLIAAVLEREGLRFCSITTGQAAAKEGLSLSAVDERIRRDAIERIQAHVRFAEPFGAVVIVGSLCGLDGDLDRLIEALRECTTVDPEVKLALEPLNRYESRLVNTVADGLAIVERVGAENLGLLVDTFHANIEEPRIGEAYRNAGDRLFHVHLADSNRFVPGYGHLPFDEVWKALEAIDYQRVLVIESYPKPDRNAVMSAAQALRLQR